MGRPKHYPQRPAPPATKKLAFLARPPQLIEAQEGDRSVVLPCRIDDKPDHFEWYKSDSVQHIYRDSAKLQDERRFKRFRFIGDIKQNDYTIELDTVTLADSGEYTCQVYPLVLASDQADLVKDFSVSTTLHVRKREPIIPNLSPSSASAPYNTNLGPEAASALAGAQLGRHNLSQLSARDTGEAANQPAASLAPHNSIHPSASTAQSTYISTAPTASHHAGSTHLTSLAGLFNWPYLLLVLALVLMAANVYLVYQLVQRYMRPSKEDQLSSSSASSSSSGSCQKRAAGASGRHLAEESESNSGGGGCSSGHSTASTGCPKTPLSASYVTSPNCLSSITSTINELSGAGNCVGVDEVDSSPNSGAAATAAAAYWTAPPPETLAGQACFYTHCSALPATSNDFSSIKMNHHPYAFNTLPVSSTAHRLEMGDPTSAITMTTEHHASSNNLRPDEEFATVNVVAYLV